MDHTEPVDQPYVGRHVELLQQEGAESEEGVAALGDQPTPEVAVLVWVAGGCSGAESGHVV